MKIKPSVCVLSPDRVEADIDLTLKVKLQPHAPDFMTIPSAYAYVPFINAHDHLIGNWFPRSGDNRPYVNSHIWVEDMKQSFSYLERNRFWINDGSFVLTDPRANLLAQLGAYKNLFSGCAIVQDHAPVQCDAYYDNFPITVVKNYRQVHSITMGNWWGGTTAREEMNLTHGKMPFIVHLGEGTDDVTKQEFTCLKEAGLLKPNTLIIHGISLSREELSELAVAGGSICWCPTSNFYLIGKTLDIHSCLDLGVNVVLGTDSTQSGGVNLLDEITNVHAKFPEISLTEVYKMFTVNAAKALYLPASDAILNPARTSELLLMDALENDPFTNLVEVNSEHIKLLLHKGIPLYGDTEWLEYLDTDTADYITFRVGKREKFVIGDPLELNDQIDLALGYHKDFPYLPF